MNEFDELLQLDRLLNQGLCQNIETKRCRDILDMFTPTREDQKELILNMEPWIFWGNEFPGQAYELTDRRLTILILCSLIYEEKYG